MDFLRAKSWVPSPIPLLRSISSLLCVDVDVKER
jgi:hypothetical protein